MKKFKEALQMYLSLDGSLFRYSLSFCLLLALLPTLIVVILLFQNSIFNFHDLLNILYHFLPEDLLEPFIEYIMDKNFTSIVSIVVSLVVAIYVASKSFYSFIMISAAHEHFHTRNILLRVKSFLMFVIFLVGIILCGIIVHIFHISAYVSYSVGLFVLFYFLYRSLSFEKRPRRFGIIGAVFSTVGIILVEWGFLFVVKEFTSYQNVYGPLASLVVMFLSIYIVSSIIYGGYCINQIYGGHLAQKQLKSEWFYKQGEKFLNKFKRKNEVHKDESKNNKNGD